MSYKQSFILFFAILLIGILVNNVSGRDYSTGQAVYGVFADGNTNFLNLTCQLRACALSDCSGASWVTYTNNTFSNLSSLPNVSYFQYKATFFTENQNYTPYLFNFTIGYTLFPTAVATYGNLTLSWVSPNKSTYVAQNKFWNFTLNLSCSSGGDCGFVNVTLDPWAINELMAGNDLQVDKDGKIIGVVEAKAVIDEESWFDKIVEFVREMFSD